MDTTTGTESPADTARGTWAFIWYKPTKLGARPEKRTVAGTPPMLTAGVIVVRAGGLLPAGEPVGGWFVTAPSPVTYI
jgi:hypothetical protein